MLTKESIRIVSREDWGALPPTGPDKAMDGVISYALFVYTNTEPCSSKEECVKAMQDIQLYHMEHGLADIPYSFIMGGDGNTYVGRGWKWSPPVPEFFKFNPLRTLVFARIGSYQDGFQMDFQGGHKIVEFCYQNFLNFDEIDALNPLKDWNTYY